MSISHGLGGWSVIEDERPHIAAIGRSVEAGFVFRHICDGVAIAVIHAERARGGAMDTYSVRGSTDAVAARWRIEEYGVRGARPVWTCRGDCASVIGELLELPPHNDPRAPRLAVTLPDGFWLSDMLR